MPLTPLRSRSLRALASLLASALLAGSTPAAFAQAPGPADQLVLDAREAWRRHDRDRLAEDKAAAVVGRHPLASWVDYWELNNRLSEAQQDELEAFYSRWPGSYVEDRLRNDWLLELGHRRDWANFAREFPRFRMNDDREVTCYWLLTEHLTGRDVTAAARAAWAAQRDTDEGCTLLATTLVDAKRFTTDDVWRVARLAVENNRPRVARFAAGLASPDAAKAVGELLDNPAKYLSRKASVLGRTRTELTTLAVMRMAWNDPEAAAGQLEQRWEHALPAELAGAAWAMVAKQAAFKLLPEAAGYYQTAWKAAHKRGNDTLEWTDDTLAWGARAALRNLQGKDRWAQVLQFIDAMSPAEQKQEAWVYWRARALAGLASSSPDGQAARAEARQLMATLVNPLTFYGQLAAEDLAQPQGLPGAPTPLMPEEVQRARRSDGFSRALQLIGLGLRGEGVREWNFMLRGLTDRELLAAAQVACDAQVWDRCINSSDRTREEIDIDQRYPVPFRESLLPAARDMGVDPAYVYGLIRQESRFVADARSAVGASGLMQVMPNTARWTAKKLGLRYSPELLVDRDTNLHIGTGYLKLVLDDFGGSQALAAAAYNAGPTRPRRWREGPALESAIWVENVPFNETRDYVKKVLSNATVYAAVMQGQALSLKARLGPSIGPREGPPPALDAELP